VPVIFREKGFRVYYFSHENGEPPHVHIDRGDCSAKIWAQPVALARNLGFASHELTTIIQMVRNHQTEILEHWHGYFGARRR
jgi:hypothetical protein